MLFKEMISAKNSKIENEDIMLEKFTKYLKHRLLPNSLKLAMNQHYFHNIVSRIALPCQCLLH